MPTREQILRELGVAVSWRLRACAAAGAAPRPFDEAPASASPQEMSAGRVVPLRPIGADERLSRIASLEWSSLAADIEACNACGLCRGRNKSVPGVGDPSAQWMLVGEAPGAEEDARGEPFVGQAGRLLDAMLAALGMDRHQGVFIANVLKCRPPGNRTPEPAEAEACRPYLERQIGLIRPALIVALGKSAASLLLGTDASIASLRGRVHRWKSIPLVVTYHPAYLLRNLPDKAKAWEDLVFARRIAAEARASSSR